MRITFKTEQDAIANNVDPKYLATMGYKTNLMKEDGFDANYYKRIHLAQLKNLLVNKPKGEGCSPRLTTVRGSGSFLWFETVVEDRSRKWRMERYSQDGKDYFVNYSSWDNGNGNDCEGVYWIEDGLLRYAPCVQEWNSFIRRHQGRIENGFGVPVAVC